MSSEVIRLQVGLRLDAYPTIAIKRNQAQSSAIKRNHHTFGPQWTRIRRECREKAIPTSYEEAVEYRAWKVRGVSHCGETTTVRSNPDEAGEIVLYIVCPEAEGNLYRAPNENCPGSMIGPGGSWTLHISMT